MYNIKALSFSILLSFVLVLSLFGNNEVDVETTIIVIDGKALLVDVDESGNVVTTYMEVNNYFSSVAEDHATKVAKAKSEYIALTQRQLDQIRFIALSNDPKALDDVMVSNLTNLSMHYQETYANEIVITAARNHRTAHLLEANIEKIKEIFMEYGVSEYDVRVEYKVDMGDEPTRFIKVVSHLRNLPTQ
ncbi:MAG: hypothetical protein ACI9FN_003260 [Saprospiraceae bacterium]|jgi:hypothetical protein